MEGQKPAVLLVDDEENVLKSLKRMLRDEGYTLHTADSADDGIKVIETEKNKGLDICVVVSDCLMPGRDGVNFLKEVRENYPGIYRIMISGNTGDYSINEILQSGLVQKFCTKPWDNEEIKESIRNGLKIYSESIKSEDEEIYK